MVFKFNAHGLFPAEILVIEVAKRAQLRRTNPQASGARTKLETKIYLYTLCFSRVNKKLTVGNFDDRPRNTEITKAEESSN